MTSEFKGKFASGLRWSITGKLISQLITFITGVVLARLILPAEFGLLAMIGVFTGLASVLVNFNFAAALVQRKGISDKDKSTVFWFGLLIGTSILIVFQLLAKSIAGFYNEPRLENIIRFVVIIFFLGPLISIHNVILLRDLNIKLQTIISIVVILLGAIFSISFAIAGLGVWALVYSNLLSACFNVIIYWSVIKWHPIFTFSFKSLKKYFNFGMNMTGESVLTYGALNADNLLVGKYLGAFELGIYNRAYNLMRLPVTSISSGIREVLFPALSKIQDDKKTSGELFLKICRVIALVTFPLMYGLSAVSEPFVMGLYGNHWKELIPILRYFFWLGGFSSILTLNGAVSRAQGRADLAFKLSLWRNITTIVAFILGLYWMGLMGIIFSYFVVLLISWIPNHIITIRLINLTLKDQVKNLGPIFIISILMAAIVFLISQLQIILDFPYIIQLIILVSLGIIIYFSLLKIFNIRALNESIKFIKDSFGQK